MVPIIQEAQAVRVATAENTNLLYTSSNEVLKDELGAPLYVFYVFVYSFTWRRCLLAETRARKATKRTVFSEFLKRY